MRERLPQMRRLLAALAALSLLWTAPAPPARAGAAAGGVPLEDAAPEALHNVLLATRAVNGCWVSRGGEFSFNATLGPLTRGEGWLDAPDAAGEARTGGGAERAAQALALTLRALDDGVEFQELHMADGAVTVDADAGLDLRFANRGEAFTLAMWIEDGALRCSAVPDAGEAWPEPPAEGAMARPDAPVLASAAVALDGGEAAAANALLAADSVYDTTLRTGDVFSFNDVVGPLAERYGFAPAPDGRGEAAPGGGVGQLASAIWLAVKQLEDFVILEKATYGGDYVQRYVASSADAILVDEASGIDFVFRYAGAGSVTLFTYAEGGALFCEILRQ